MPDNTGRGHVNDVTPEDRERESRMRKGVPGGTFDCPNRAQALKLSRAFRVWGASSVVIEDRVVTVEASQRWINTLAVLFGDGTIERLQRSEITAEELAGHFPRETEPGETRG